MKDAGLKRIGGRIVATGTSREGRTLIADGMKAALISEIGARQAGAAASPVAAVVKAVDPKLTTADAKAFAPKMRVISKYSVFYLVIVNNHWGGNIEAPATKINGTVVPPGGKFDFWKVVGDLHKAPGEGRATRSRAGRSPSPARSAAASAPRPRRCSTRRSVQAWCRSPDRTTTSSSPVSAGPRCHRVDRRQGQADHELQERHQVSDPDPRIITHAGSKRWLTFKIWSVPNHRNSKISNLSIQHGPRARNTIVRDSSKPVGYRFFNNAPADGAKVAVTVSIYDHGKLHWRKRYFSNYPAVNGVTVIGTRR